MSERRLEYLPIDELVPDPRNPKDHSLATLRASYARWGYTMPMMIDERTGMLVAGHGRREVLLDDQARGQDPPDGVRLLDGGRWAAPVIRGWSSADDLEAWGYIVADNRLPEEGGWHHELMAPHLEALAQTPHGLEGVGYTQEQVDEIVARARQEAEPEPRTPADEVPPLPARPKSKLGDVWLLGPHRLVCGDSTDPTVVEAALEGRRPRIVWTDPPYGIDYQAVGGSTPMAGDATLDEAQALITANLKLVADAEAHFVCGNWRSLPITLAAMEAAGLEPKACIVWNKETGGHNLDRYARVHELVLLGAHEQVAYAGPYGGEETVATDVWTIKRDTIPDHPTPKPVELITRALETASPVGALVYDGFAGSGSTLIAAHATARTAALVELDPRYVDVICARWQAHTGQPPARPDGSTLDFA